MIAPTSGNGRVAGLDIFTQAEDIKQAIGYMSQKFSLYLDMTPFENIRFYLGIYNVPVPQMAGSDPLGSGNYTLAPGSRPPDARTAAGMAAAPCIGLRLAPSTQNSVPGWNRLPAWIRLPADTFGSLSNSLPARG